MTFIALIVVSGGAIYQTYRLSHSSDINSICSVAYQFHTPKVFADSQFFVYQLPSPARNYTYTWDDGTGWQTGWCPA
jgi:hypothetical protein